MQRCRNVKLVSSRPEFPSMTPRFHLEIEAEYIGWDGVYVQNIRTFSRIENFTNEIFMEDLLFVPLKYHPRREEIAQNIMQRYHATVGLWKPMFQYVEYYGNALLQFPNSSSWQVTSVSRRVSKTCVLIETNSYILIGQWKGDYRSQNSAAFGSRERVNAKEASVQPTPERFENITPRYTNGRTGTNTYAHASHLRCSDILSRNPCS